MVNTISTHDNACGSDKHPKCRCKVCTIAEINSLWDSYPDDTQIAYAIASIDNTYMTVDQRSVVCATNVSKGNAHVIMDAGIANITKGI